MTQQTETLNTQYDTFLEHSPKPVANFVPSNGPDQRRAFLRGEVRNPSHNYNRLDRINYDNVAVAIAEAGEDILENPTLNSKFASVYEASIARNQQKNRFMQLAHDFKHAEAPEEKDRIAEAYMTLNIELYGAPDEQTYRSLMQEKLQKIHDKELSQYGEEIRVELFELTNFQELDELPERFKPEKETIEWMHGVAQTLYGGMLEHIPEKKDFSVNEIQAIFDEIIREEFGQSAAEWSVDIEGAKAINVKAGEKRIVLPDDLSNVSLKKLRHLVVHEIGVHMLRSVIGGETDLHPLMVGLEDYYDAEEGLGMVMQQALDDKFTEAGVDHYITAGAAYLDNMDPRQIFEIKWRMEVLDSLDNGKVVSPLAVAKAKKKAYNNNLRSFRGTDELPWFKDLAYYNGSADMWHYLESIRGDDIKFMFVLLGKANPANIAHQRIQYETATT